MLSAVMRMGYTSILVQKSTRDDLRGLGKKGQSYDSLLQELILLRREHKD
jgi:hypothetical protein